jgi:iron complex outermembrane receptor protein
VPVTPSNRIPGIARQMAFAALTWNPPQGWRAGVEARYLGRMHVNDSNTEAAPGYFIAAAHAGYLLRRDRSTLQTYLRIDNLFGRRYAGSTIINESNGRYYEPAPGRNWSAGVSAALRF